MPSLTSTIRDLHRRRGRERRGLTLAEGVRLVEEVLATGTRVHGAVVGPSLQATRRGADLEAALRQAGVRLEEMPDAELARLAGTEHPQGIVAVIEPPAWTLDDIRPPAGSVVLVLDGVQDPGNVGTMLRTAHGLGAAGVVALPGTADLANPKVVRASMGALFRLPCVATADAEWQGWVERHGLELWVAEAGGSMVPAARPARPVALVVGNEGAGVRPELSSAARAVSIPLARGAESLNVAVAAGILLYEVTRER